MPIKQKRTSVSTRWASLKAAETFSDPRGFVMSDRKHSTSEERFYWIGMSESGRIPTTRYTKRGGKIRIIGSGEWREFKRIYNEKAKRKDS
jgi:uncharacterized DUF497 family protein